MYDEYGGLVGDGLNQASFLHHSNGHCHGAWLFLDGTSIWVIRMHVKMEAVEFEQEALKLSE